MEDDPFLEMKHLEEARRKAVASNLRVMDDAELRKLGDRLFPSAADPWRDAFLKFIDDNPGTAVYHGTTHDHVQVVYSPDADRGFWFMGSRGIGVLQERGRQLMKELIAQRRSA